MLSQVEGCLKQPSQTVEDPNTSFIDEHNVHTYYPSYDFKLLLEKSANVVIKQDVIVIHVQLCLEWILYAEQVWVKHHDLHFLTQHRDFLKEDSPSDDFMIFKLTECLKTTHQNRDDWKQIMMGRIRDTFEQFLDGCSNFYLYYEKALDKMYEVVQLIKT